MTVEQVKNAIRTECHKHSPCCYDGEYKCALFLGEVRDCYEDVTNEELIHNYNVIYPNNPIDHIDEEVVEEVVENTKSDIINHPAHYNREGAMESIEEMELIFGKEAVKHFCLCNAWKYRYRASDKNGQEDLKKSDWYMRKYKELSANGTTN